MKPTHVYAALFLCGLGVALWLSFRLTGVILFALVAGGSLLASWRARKRLDRDDGG